MKLFDISVNCWYFAVFFDHFNMDAIEVLVSNIDRLCNERGWKRRNLAKAMGVKAESLSRSLNGQPRLDTIEKIAKALNVSIKSLFDDPVAVEGFVSVGGMVQRFNTREEFERIVESRPKLTLTMGSPSDEDDGLPFD